MLNRRHFHQLALLPLASLVGVEACFQSARSPIPTEEREAAWESIETTSGGRLGVAIFDSANGAWTGHRIDERFPMCSTFKWLAAAYVLHRVDRGQEKLDRRIRYGSDALLPWSPETEKHADGSGMTVAELCEAAIAMSDNTAANLILKALGGPSALTHFLRTQGDTVTRLDRWEPDVNTSIPGDGRDTSSPRAMATLLRRWVLEPTLSDGSRERLVQWLRSTNTNTHRLAAGLPTGWKLGSKTGTGPYGTTNDVGVYWPMGRAPIVAAVFLTESEKSQENREDALARVARMVFTGMGHGRE